MMTSQVAQSHKASGMRLGTFHSSILAVRVFNENEASVLTVVRLASCVLSCCSVHVGFCIFSHQEYAELHSSSFSCLVVSLCLWCFCLLFVFNVTRCDLVA